MRFPRTAADACALSGFSVTDVVQTSTQRPSIRGKYLSVGREKFIARGVTYGPFRPDADGCVYHDPDVVSRDFAMMGAAGINTVRTYTCPPRWLLDVAAQQGLRVLAGVGLAGEQQSAFLSDRALVRAVEERCAKDVRACAGHPALLAYAIGNEIPASIVRWHGRRRVERFLHSLYCIAKEHDEGGLVTYVNYPTTEYLQLPFLDFCSYNLYLEQRDAFESYVVRLQNIADYKPLVIAEIGLDTLRNGEPAQSEAIEWQIRSSFAAGCAGALVFSWTDEWHTGGADVGDWQFGITDAVRRPKAAVAAVRRAFAEVPFAPDPKLPRLSVIVATYNGARTIAECLDGCTKLKYPDYEVIVINDGSTDSTAEIAARFDVRLINTPNAGLSRARNRGLDAATGELIAYIDDDARPDEHWLRFIAHAFATSDHVGIGGPNIAPADDPALSQCIANSPGGPTHVLLTDRLAEHIPGCNMAFRTDRLREVGGFDEQFRIAGDDVDVCWKLQARGWTLGFHPAAVVYHHRRTSLKAYWRQQVNYGRAEAMLEVKWPEKYNAIGHIGWRGRLYGTGACRGFGALRSRIYHGTWGTAAFQPLCPTASSFVTGLPLMPEWYLATVALLALGAMGLLWSPLLVFLVSAPLAVTCTVLQAAHASRESFAHVTCRRERLKMRGVTAFLHIFQSVARLYGRIGYGLTPWRRRMRRALALPCARDLKLWDEHWQSVEQRLKSIETMLKAEKVWLRRGGAFDDWDLEVRGGLFASVRTRVGIEEYPGGKQHIRFRVWPTFSMPAAALATIPACLALLAAWNGAPLAALALALVVLLLLLRAAGDCAASATCLLDVLGRYGKSLRPVPAVEAAAKAAAGTLAVPEVASDPPRAMTTSAQRVESGVGIARASAAVVAAATTTAATAIAAAQQT
jgi:GT2 family glycosyltransferase